jgi:hypothetical protein
MLQFIGTDCLRNLIKTHYPTIGDNLWTMSFKKTIDDYIKKGYRKFVIPDIRFPNEEQILRKYHNCNIIRVIRHGINSTDTHVSENLIDQIKTDIIIHNDTFEQLYISVDIAMNTFNSQ